MDSHGIKFIFESKLGSRVHRGFVGVQIESVTGSIFWWSYEERRWFDHCEWIDGLIKGPCSNIAPVHTLRAFRSHIKKHRASLSGLTAVLHSRYVGHNVAVNIP